ncbi:MAG: hypothetical protein ACK4WC_01680 [Rubrimonas sp.]
MTSFAPVSSGLRYGGRFDPDAVPFVSAEARRDLATNHANRPGARALAIHRNGAYGCEHGASSRQAARDGSVRRCAQFSEIRGCFIYDLEGMVEFSRDTPLRNPRGS